MKCPKCAREIPDDAHLCCYCGRKFVRKQSKRMRGNGMGTAYKRGRTWTASYTVGWREEGDKLLPEKRTKGGFATKSDALAYIPTLKTSKSETAKKLTFMQLYDAWEAVHEKKVKASTMGCYKAAKNYYKDIFYLPFGNIGLDDLQDCVDGCPKGKRTKENMKALGTLLYKYALPRHISDMNYAEFIDCGDGKKGTRNAFSTEQIEVIRRGIGEVPYADYIYCLIYTGFRPNEMLSLKRGAYDLAKNMLIGGFKTEAGTDRPVPVSPKIASLIREAVLRADPYIFPRPDGRLMRDDYFRENCFYPALAQLGIQPVPEVGERPDYVPYSCRHTFANLMKNVSGSDTDKAALIGHASPEMTKYYQSADLESLKRIIEMI